MGSWAGSLIIHATLLVIFALVVFPIRLPDFSNAITVQTTVPGRVDLQPLEEFEIAPQGSKIDAVEVAKALIPDELTDLPDPQPLDVMQSQLELEVETREFLGQVARVGDLGGRSQKGRRLLTRAFGGTAASEEAVSEGLEWLKRHQHSNGSWSFDHHVGECDDTCSAPGRLRRATIAATAMAMLCYVGAGHTHQQGAYQPQVKWGLDFLREQARKAPKPGDLRQLPGNSGMYAQGLATILLCELTGLTDDDEVRRAAQQCVQFVVAAQHPRTGGWRYEPRDPDGDTSVVGWQVMALTSARMAGLPVSDRADVRTDRFLDSVQMDQGAYYGYMTPHKKASTTAIGLLCRMYMGWKKDREPLQHGVRYLSELGPSRDNMYYNYYATQVLHHWGGAEWTAWNDVMRDELVSTQTRAGHSRGSWYPRDPHGDAGGRHYMTCLAIMTLEVYYRHLPLYQLRSVQIR